MLPGAAADPDGSVGRVSMPTGPQAPPTTGDDAVDGALQELGGRLEQAGQDPAAHVDAYDALQRSLQDRLGDLDG